MKTKINRVKMKTYIVSNGEGVEVAMIKAKSHNEAEQEAKAKYGENATVAYTEI
jgi:hypothetical protein